MSDFEITVKINMELNELLKQELSKYEIKINSNEYSVFQIFNFSLLKMKGNDFVREMSKYDVYVSSTSACSSSLNNSIVLEEITKGDSMVSTTSIRVSISHLTTKEDIEKFIIFFDKIYNEKIKDAKL